MEETELLLAESTPKDYAAVVLEGPDQGRKLSIERRLLIGTSTLCDVQLTDRAVSRRHCTLEPHPGGVRLRDADSRNGTWFDQIRITGADLPEGAEFRIGKTRIRIQEDRAPKSAPPQELSQAASFGRFLGRSVKLAPMYKVLELASKSDVTVLLEGESGTGKEVLAEAIHDESPRSQGPFVVVDFAAMPEMLIESTLFGHEKGAFTGADQTRVGAFEEASGGTIFLDEIGELPLQLQTRLLGVLERRRFRRVGGGGAIDVDVRVIAATNRNLEREVEEGRFRLDLFHRLAVALVRVPALRERPEDIPRLAAHFAKALKIDPAQVLTAAVLQRLKRNEWPGNVRELRNHVERLALFGENAVLLGSPAPSPSTGSGVDDVAKVVKEAAGSGLVFRQARGMVVERFTQLYVQSMLDRFDGDVAKASEAAGVARRHFNRLRASGSDKD